MGESGGQNEATKKRGHLTVGENCSMDKWVSCSNLSGGKKAHATCLDRKSGNRLNGRITRGRPRVNVKQGTFSRPAYQSGCEVGDRGRA